MFVTGSRQGGHFLRSPRGKWQRQTTAHAKVEEQVLQAEMIQFLRAADVGQSIIEKNCRDKDPPRYAEITSAKEMSSEPVQEVHKNSLTNLQITREGSNRHNMYLHFL